MKLNYYFIIILNTDISFVLDFNLDESNVN